MIKLKYIIVFLVLTSASCFSQTTFNNLDSLFTKNFDAVNKRDSVYYLSLLNQSLVFKDKSAKNKADSLVILNPFTESFNLLIASLSDMTTDPDFTVSFLNYELKNKKTASSNGKIPLHVNILVNNTFTLKLPFVVYVTNGTYSIVDPMMVMFVDTKD